MINDLTAYFRIYQLEYHQYRKITIDLKQEFVKRTSYSGYCVFCGQLNANKVCNKCMQYNLNCPELVILNRNERYIHEIELIEKMNVYIKQYPAYDFKKYGSQYFFNISQLFHQIGYKSKQETHYKIIISDEIVNIYNFIVYDDESIYMFHPSQDTFLLRFDKIQFDKLKKVNFDLYVIFTHYKTKKTIEYLNNFYVKRIERKIKLIDEQIESNLQNLKTATINQHTDDIKAFNDINFKLCEFKEDLLRKKLNFI